MLLLYDGSALFPPGMWLGAQPPWDPSSPGPAPALRSAAGPSGMKAWRVLWPAPSVEVEGGEVALCLTAELGHPFFPLGLRPGLRTWTLFVLRPVHLDGIHHQLP